MGLILAGIYFIYFLFYFLFMLLFSIFHFSFFSFCGRISPIAGTIPPEMRSPTCDSGLIADSTPNLLRRRHRVAVNPFNEPTIKNFDRSGRAAELNIVGTAERLQPSGLDLLSLNIFHTKPSNKNNSTVLTRKKIES